MFVSVDVATIELMEYPLIEIVMALGTALVKVTVKLTLVVARPIESSQGCRMLNRPCVDD